QQQYYAQQRRPKETAGSLHQELKQFIQCAQGQADLTLCQGFNEALRQCKQSHHLQ
ncbi:GM13491, partial [Drosophila sechellia]